MRWSSLCLYAQSKLSQKDPVSRPSWQQLYDFIALVALRIISGFTYDLAVAEAAHPEYRTLSFAQMQNCAAGTRETSCRGEDGERPNYLPRVGTYH